MVEEIHLEGGTVLGTSRGLPNVSEIVKRLGAWVGGLGGGRAGGRAHGVLGACMGCMGCKQCKSVARLLCAYDPALPAFLL